MRAAHDVRPTVDRSPLAAGLDAAAVVVFVAIGRRNHDEDPGLGGLIQTAAPFLVALAVTWIGLRAWRRPDGIATGAGLWVGTVTLGMLLRRYVFDAGTAASFVVVATAFLGVTLVGWRLVARAVRGRGSPSRRGRPSSR